MSYYIRLVPLQHGSFPEVWKIESDSAFRIGITNPTIFKAEGSETIWDTFKRLTSWFEPNGHNPFHKTALQPGEFYPRMARPNDQHPDESPGANPGAQTDKDFIAISRGQLTVLMRQLNRICQTVHPTEKMLGTFGHDIRNLLIIACTEVESHWRGVLVANGVQGYGANDNRFTTHQYVNLNAAMRLDEYAVEFPSYPWLPAISPFAGWGSSDKPTQELPWYDAYNAVKHNRGAEFERATLGHAFDAVTACAIMMAAQFGLPHGLGQGTELGSFFHFSTTPRWPLSDVYIYPYGEMRTDGSPVRFGFRSAHASKDRRPPNE